MPYYTYCSGTRDNRVGKDVPRTFGTEDRPGRAPPRFWLVYNSLLTQGFVSQLTLASIKGYGELDPSTGSLCSEGVAGSVVPHLGLQLTLTAPKANQIVKNGTLGK